MVSMYLWWWEDMRYLLIYGRGTYHDPHSGDRHLT